MREGSEIERGAERKREERWERGEPASDRGQRLDIVREK